MSVKDQQALDRLYAIDNVLTGNDGANKIDGVDGNDSVAGAGGNDTLTGGTGSDTLAGGKGDDVYVVDGVPAKLVFRIDRNEAQAVRLPPSRSP